MAITAANLTQGSSTTASTNATTASVTLAAGKSYLLWACQNRGGDITASAPGWTLHTHKYFDAVSIDLLYRDGDGSSGTITITWTGSTSRKGWGIDEITGAASGASLIVQIGTNHSAASTTPNATLAAFADGTNNAAMLGVICDLTATNCTPGTGYTALTNVLMSGSNGTVFSQYLIGQDLSPDCTSPNVEWAAIAAEIAVAAAAGWGPLLGGGRSRLVVP